MFRRSFYSTAFPRRDVNQMRRLARNFGSPRVRVVSSYPAMNIWSNEDGAIVTAKLPGVSLEDIDISVKENTVTIAAVRNPVELEDNDKYLRRERRYGKFSRSFQLPFAVDSENIAAIFEKGILTVNLPRAEADKPRKITVNAA